MHTHSRADTSADRGLKTLGGCQADLASPRHRISRTLRPSSNRREHTFRSMQRLPSPALKATRTSSHSSSLLPLSTCRSNILPTRTSKHTTRLLSAATLPARLRRPRLFCLGSTDTTRTLKAREPTRLIHSNRRATTMGCRARAACMERSSHRRSRRTRRRRRCLR